MQHDTARSVISHIRGISNEQPTWGKPMPGKARTEHGVVAELGPSLLGASPRCSMTRVICKIFVRLHTCALANQNSGTKVALLGKALIYILRCISFLFMCVRE